ncbi:hypothetical protein NQ317_007027 [Molorchus minor]|uniref:Organic cation transporter n=1 Tax=Molorchus minor TaxID=1323400 RepID=A0ABQ9J074_9CUCU|nr:hypothetical protein NQ317_007027 [Molorchus minor]
MPKDIPTFCVEECNLRVSIMERQHILDFDDMLEELGELGKFQVYTYILICLPVLFAAANSLSYVFTAGIPEYRCYIPECEDALDTSYEVPWMDWAIPSDTSTNQVIGVKVDSCSRYAVNQSVTNATCSQDIFTDVVEKCSEWVFDDAERTIVTDWNMTCVENQWKLSLVGTSHFAGIVVGSCVFGLLADCYVHRIVRIR